MNTQAQSRRFDQVQSEHRSNNARRIAMFKKSIVVVPCAVAALFAANFAQAALIAPSTISATTWYDSNVEPLNLINGDGLSSESAGATHSQNNAAFDQWHTGSGQPGAGSSTVDDQSLTFDLGGTFDLSSMYVWQFNQQTNLGRGVKQYDVFVSTNDEGSYTQVITNANLTVSGGGNIFAQTVPLVQSGVTHVRFEIDTNFNGDTTGFVGLSEVRFEGTAPSQTAPEPSALILAALGVIGLCIRRRRRARA